MKYTVLLLLCIALCTGCSRTPEEAMPPDTTPAHDSDTSVSQETLPAPVPPETEPPEAEYISPPVHTIPPAYNSIREYAAAPDAPMALRELAGLPEGFQDVLVETGGGYCITYANWETAIAFFPLENEAALEAYMAAQLAGSGTYEALLTNDLISDVRKTDLPAEGEILYECLYNTSIKTDLKLRYRECTADGIRFVLSVSYDSDGSQQYCQMFAFAEDASFACGSSAPFSDAQLFALRSVPLQ